MVAFKDSVASIAMESDLLCITVHKEGLLSVLEHLRNELGFTFLTTLCGMHFPDTEQELGVVYHLNNMREGHRLQKAKGTCSVGPDTVLHEGRHLALAEGGVGRHGPRDHEKHQQEDRGDDHRSLSSLRLAISGTFGAGAFNSCCLR